MIVILIVSAAVAFGFGAVATWRTVTRLWGASSTSFAR